MTPEQQSDQITHSEGQPRPKITPLPLEGIPTPTAEQPAAEVAAPQAEPIQATPAAEAQTEPAVAAAVEAPADAVATATPDTEVNPYKTGTPDGVKILPPEAIIDTPLKGTLALQIEVSEILPALSLENKLEGPATRNKIIQPSERDLFIALDKVNDALEDILAPSKDPVLRPEQVVAAVPTEVRKKLIMAFLLDNQQKLTADPDSTDTDLSFQFGNEESKKRVLDDRSVQMMLLAIPFLEMDKVFVQSTIQLTNANGLEASSPLYRIVTILGAERMKNLVQYMAAEFRDDRVSDEGFVLGVKSSFMEGDQSGTESYLYQFSFRPYDLVKKAVSLV